MIDVLTGWITDLRILGTAIIALMTLGMMIMAWGKTKSAGAVVGVFVVGVFASIAAINMIGIAGWVGDDLNKQVDGTDLAPICTEWGSCTSGG
ncbi:MAG: hypothetical protein F4Z31_04545 [Gemmatimonadetes bacterium]|nr:hypothetical protein [Gemmatimonadota bacterium]MYF07767.1 hypothetical protein [Rhodospirillaceae bacterium]